MTKYIVVAISSFLVGSLASLLIIVDYAGYDVFSVYHGEPYSLKRSIKILDAKNDKIIEFQEGLVVNLVKSYSSQATVSFEFIIDLIDLDTVAEKQEHMFPYRYWHVQN
ncbi:MAG: hypothetical protein OEZ43_00035 [Gammaproteobacteria bacterium]|nr:hypothetical protein [Gammaproteobacteria bacterium]